MCYTNNKNSAADMFWLAGRGIMASDKYYMKGDESFGLISSLGYYMIIHLPSVREFYRFVVDDLEHAGNSDVLDVGTGPADVPKALAQSGVFRHIYAVDPSEGMLRIARRRTKGLGINFSKGSSRHLGLKRKFGLITTAMSFHAWPDKAQSLRYLSRFLGKGGKIMIYEMERKRLSGTRRLVLATHAVSENEVREAAKGAGLRVSGIKRQKSFIRVTIVK